MNDMKVNWEFIESCKRSFTPLEWAFFTDYKARLLSYGFLGEEEAEEAACYRVLQERRT